MRHPLALNRFANLLLDCSRDDDDALGGWSSKLTDRQKHLFLCYSQVVVRDYSNFSLLTFSNPSMSYKLVEESTELREADRLNIDSDVILEMIQFCDIILLLEMDTNPSYLERISLVMKDMKICFSKDDFILAVEKAKEKALSKGPLSLSRQRFYANLLN